MMLFSMITEAKTVSLSAELSESVLHLNLDLCFAFPAPALMFKAATSYCMLCSLTRFAVECLEYFVHANIHTAVQIDCGLSDCIMVAGMQNSAEPVMQHFRCLALALQNTCFVHVHVHIACCSTFHTRCC